MSEEIRAAAIGLAVPFLLHFTRADNLRSILRHGLYPVSRLSELGSEAKINDTLRLDGHRDSNSLSIAFPNGPMFYKYRMEDESVNWAVLQLTPSILWNAQCAFCAHNAADSRIRHRDLAELESLPAFKEMYDEIQQHPSRAAQFLRPYDPTDVQAEVLVFDVISPESIRGIAVNDPKLLTDLADVIGSRKTYVQPMNKGVFANRTYARRWSR